MPRTARACSGGYTYHILNRGNARATVFHKPDDYEAFVDMMAEASVRTPMRILAYCLMPNHFHLALWPRDDGDLSRWMHWLMTTHVRRYLRHYRSSGHVWQGRFKAFPTQEDEHLLTLLRYIERNPLRARLVGRAEDWPGRACTGWRCPNERRCGWSRARCRAVPSGSKGSMRRPPTSIWRACASRCAAIGHSDLPPGRRRRPEPWVWSTASDREGDREALNSGPPGSYPDCPEHVEI